MSGSLLTMAARTSTTVIAGKKLPAGQQFVENDAEGPDIGATVHVLAAGLLRRHVSGGAEDHAGVSFVVMSRVHGQRGRVLGIAAGLGGVLAQFRESEIQHLDGAVGLDLDIARFEVAMRDAFFVRGIEGVSDLGGEFENVVDGQGALGFDAFDELHDHVARAAGRGSNIVKLRDVGMVQLGDGAAFTLEALGKLFAGSFDRNFAVEAGVAGLVDFAHAARADARKDFVGSKTVAGGQRHRERL